MDTILPEFFILFTSCILFTAITWFWWKTTRRFFIFLFYFNESKLKIKKNSWQYILFNYGIFGPLGVINISVYLYVLLVFIKFFIF